MTTKTDNMTLAAMVAEYNELTGSTLRKFRDRKTAVIRLEAARKDAAKQARKSNRKSQDAAEGPKMPREGTALYTLLEKLRKGQVDVKAWAARQNITESYGRAQIGYLRDKGWNVVNVERGTNLFTLEAGVYEPATEEGEEDAS